MSRCHESGKNSRRVENKGEKIVKRIRGGYNMLILCITEHLKTRKNALYTGPYGHYLVIMDFAEVPTTMILYERISTV